MGFAIGDNADAGRKARAIRGPVGKFRHSERPS
jgi:hypothetical protein